MKLPEAIKESLEEKLKSLSEEIEEALFKRQKLVKLLNEKQILILPDKSLLKLKKKEIWFGYEYLKVFVDDEINKKIKEKKRIHFALLETPMIDSSQIKENISLSQVVSEYTQIKKKGRKCYALCPFHTESSPSFTIFDDKTYYCFGCGKSGDVINFIMEIKDLDYLQAIKYLKEYVRR